jgi:hypothetical protein
VTDFKWSGKELSRSRRCARILHEFSGREWISQRDVSKDVPLAQESMSCFVVGGVRRALFSLQRRLRFEVAVSDIPFNRATWFDDIIPVSRR